MILLDSLIGEAEQILPVKRREEGTRDASGRYTPGPSITADVRLRVQTRGTNLVRVLAGDSSTGQVDVWAPLADLAAAEDQANPGVPLGWTALQIAPAEHTERPPGDRVVWKGREYEITTEEPHDGDGPLIAGFRKYVGTDRGAAA